MTTAATRVGQASRRRGLVRTSPSPAGPGGHRTPGIRGPRDHHCPRKHRANSVNRLTVEVDSAPTQFQSRYEQAVPLFPAKQVAELVRRQGPWQDMLDLMTTASPLGFFIFYKIDVAPTVRPAGDKAFGVAYLMGNNTLMESMFRYEPAIVLYAPLHIVIWGDPDGPGCLTFDKPSDQFGSFGSTEVSNVGAELGHKLAALLEHLGVRVPDELLRPGQPAC